MFFRETRSRNSKSPVLQLVENIRTEKGPRQRLIVSLGTNFPIQKEDRRPVASIVQDRLRGQLPLFENDPRHIACADKIVKKIQTEGKWESPRIQVHRFKEGVRKDKTTAEVFINDVQHGYSRELGPVLIGHTFWERLGFSEILKKCGFYDKQIKTAEISVLNRLIAQDSEHAILSWLDTVSLEELLDINTAQFGDDRFYRVSDLLLKNREEIERNLYQREKDLFSLEDSIFLYDLTNTYFEGICAQNPKAEFNKNQKEKRTDCRQVVVALMIDGEGFIRRHRLFNGKMSDAMSLKKILEKLADDFQNKKMPTIIFDRGVVSKENLELLKSYENLKYIVMCRPGEEALFVDEFKANDFEIINGANSHVEVSLRTRGDEVFVLCKSQGRKEKETAMRSQREQRFEEALKKLSKQSHRTKNNGAPQIERSIGRLKERYSSVAKYYDIHYDHWTFSYELEDDVPKRLANSLENVSRKISENKITFNALRKKIDQFKEKYPAHKVRLHIKPPELSWHTIDEKEARERQMDGNYLLKTNRKDLDKKDIWNLYIMLTRVENAFRDLKSHLGLRPNFHQKEKRVDGHIFISILAYHLLHSIEHTLGMYGSHSRWATIKRLVSSHHYASIQLPITNGTVINVRKPGVPEGIHIEIYNKLDVNFESLPVRRNLA